MNKPSNLLLIATTKAIDCLLPKAIEIPVGVTEIDNLMKVRVCGTITKGGEELYTPTTSIPTKTVVALLLKRMGATRESAKKILTEVMTEALLTGSSTDEALKATLGEFDEAEKHVKKILGDLPKKTREGKTKYSAHSDIEVLK